MVVDLTLQPLQMFSGDFLSLAIVFIVLAIIAAVVGARGVAGISMAAAKWLIIIFVVLAVISLIL
jgi:uncharacterized membrane protein YtjA (UPF0391 family)